MKKADIYRILRIRARMAEIKEIAKDIDPEFGILKASVTVLDAAFEKSYDRACERFGGKAGNHRFSLHSIDVLSEPDNPTAALSLSDVSWLIDDGPSVGTHQCEFDIEIPAFLAAEGLTMQGSEPAFFNLNPDGSMTDPEETPPIT